MKRQNWIKADIDNINYRYIKVLGETDFQIIGLASDDDKVVNYAEVNTSVYSDNIKNDIVKKEYGSLNQLRELYEGVPKVINRVITECVFNQELFDKVKIVKTQKFSNKCDSIRYIKAYIK